MSENNDNVVPFVRQEESDPTVVTGGVRNVTMGWLDKAGTSGLTWRDLATITGWHHGQASSVLSIMHQHKWIVRLRETRNRCGVYVLPEHVAGREVAKRGTSSANKRLAQAIPILEELSPCTTHVTPERDCIFCKAEQLLYEWRQR